MKDFCIKIPILILTEILFISVTFAQLTERPNIELISERDGLPFNVCTSIVQDKQGFIWVGGTDGLARYDGYSFVTVQLKHGGKNSLPNNNVASLEIDKDGSIWIGHAGGSVSKVNPKTFNVWHTKIKSADETSVTRIFCDRKGTMWFGVHGMGLYRFDGNNSIRHVCDLNDLPQNEATPSLLYNVITDFYEDQDNNLWLASFNGLYKFSTRDSSLNHISIYPSKDIISISQLLPYGIGGFWCSTSIGLIYYDFTLKKSELYPYPKGNQGVYSMTLNNKNEIWLGTLKGTWVFQIDTKRFSALGSGELNIIFDCTRFMKGSEGIIWSLSPKGIFKWNPLENHFKFYKPNVKQPDDYFIEDVINDQKYKRLVIGTGYADGLHIIDSTGKEKTFAIPRHYKGEPYNLVNDLVQNKAGDIYVVMRDYLLLLTPDNQLKRIDEINSLLPKSTVPFFYRMIEAENGDLWVASSRNGLFHLDSKTHRWEHIPTASPYRLGDNKVRAIIEDKNHRIWLMHTRIGLTVYDPLTKSWTNYQYESGKPGSIISKLLTGMTITSEGEIFISSWEGISKFNPKTNSFENHNISTGLPAESFYSIEHDDENNLWAATNKGVLKIDPHTWKTELFSFKDGLSGVYYYYTLSRGTQGKMYIGTMNGFYAFNPSEIKGLSRPKVPLIITSIKTLGPNKVEQNLPKKFLVDYENNSIVIEYAALNYSNSQKNIYRYRMEGLDKDWTETTEHSVNYSGIPSGSYSFQVQLTGSVSQCSVNIFVSTPFWKQDWFIMALATFGLCLIYLGYRIRLNQVRKEEKIKRDYSQKLADVEMKALKAQMNPHFIFNSLNSINRYIVKSDPEMASMYLTKFSKLIRLILDNSDRKIVSLEHELNALKLYIELEALRFNERFTFIIQVEDDTNPLLIGVPPMVIQPFVENAIWHGLLHKDSPGRLEINIKRYGKGVQCTIIDNGVGRKKAAELKSKSVNKEKSYGMKITYDRLSMLNSESKIAIVEVTDLKDENNIALGTKVIVRIASADLEPEF